MHKPFYLLPVGKFAGVVGAHVTRFGRLSASVPSRRTGMGGQLPVYLLGLYYLTASFLTPCSYEPAQRDGRAEGSFPEGEVAAPDAWINKYKCLLQVSHRSNSSETKLI